MDNGKLKLWQRISLAFRKKRMADFEAFYLEQVLAGGVMMLQTK